MEINKIATVYTDFPDKFGIPRQSGIVESLKGKIIFEPKYRDVSSVKGLSEYSHIWILWMFSKTGKKDWSPTVRPPRLGGNTRVGVFATRSPNRPNPIGLSAVKLDRIVLDKELGPVLEVTGIDMVDGTSVVDIKPYLSFADSYPGAVCGFADSHLKDKIKVEIPDEIQSALTPELKETLYGILSDDPRPHYQNDENRIYGFNFKNFEIKFRVANNLLTVISVTKV